MDCLGNVCTFSIIYFNNLVFTIRPFSVSAKCSYDITCRDTLNVLSFWVDGPFRVFHHLIFYAVSFWLPFNSKLLLISFPLLVDKLFKMFVGFAVFRDNITNHISEAVCFALHCCVSTLSVNKDVF